MKSTSIYGDVLEFDSKKHQYTLNDKSVPGVTTINKFGYPKSEALLRWQIKQGIKEYETGAKAKAAANIGTLVHDYAYAAKCGKSEDLLQILSKIEKEPEKDKIFKCIEHFTKWNDQNVDEFVEGEQLVASPTYEYAGTFDRLARRGDWYILSDFKTTSGIYHEQFLQLAGYALALSEWKGVAIDGLEILRFGKTDATFETKLVTDPDEIMEYAEQFLRNVDTYYFRQKYDKSK